MEYSTLSLSKFCFAALSFTVRGYEAGLFHAYWVISSWGFRFLQMFSDRIWSQMQFTIKIMISFTCLSLKLFLLWLNNLSFFGFLWNAWTWIARCLYFCFGCEYHDFLICFDARTVSYIAEYAAVNLQQLEDAGKPVDKFTSKFWPWRNLKHFLFRRRL